MKNNKNFLIFILALIFILTLQTTMALIITSTESITNTFKPFKFPSNDLILKKSIEHPYDEYYHIPDDLTFDFDVNLGIEYANSTLLTTQGEKTTDDSGVLRVSLKPNEELYIEDITEDTKVIVTEHQTHPGFSVKDSIATKEGTINSTETLYFDYINVYQADPSITNNFTLTGTKMLEGREWPENERFAITLEYLSPQVNEWLTVATKTVTYDASNPDFNTFDFNNFIQAFEFSTIGTHYFRIKESVGNLGNDYYDETVNYFNIVTDDQEMDGQIDITEVNGFQNILVTEQDGLYNIHVTFNNNFPVIALANRIVGIPIQKIINNTGTYKIGPENFEFILIDTATNEEMRLTTNTEGLAETYLVMTDFDIGRTYNYILKEYNDGREGVTYDEREYKISITVGLDQTSQLSVKVKVNGIEENEDKIFTFENTYHQNPPITPPEDINLDININKIVNNTGDKFIGPGNFEFVLTDQTNNTTDKVRTNQSGQATIKKTYTSSDIDKTYTYKLTETNEGLEGVTYSNNEYTIEVTISLTNDNKLAATTKLDGIEVTSIDTEFINIYHVEEQPIIEDINLDIIIENIVNNTGKYSIGPKNFEFIIENIHTGATTKVISDKNGKAYYNLKFTENDIGKTYEYKLSMIKGKMKGLIYSDSIYNVKIIITLDENFKLVPLVFINNQEASEVKLFFQNTYYISPEEPALPPTIDTTNNTPYITMMIISAGGLLIILFLQEQRQITHTFALATDITNIVPIQKRKKPKLKASPKKKQKKGKSSTETYNKIKTKQRKKTAKK